MKTGRTVEDAFVVRDSVGGMSPEITEIVDRLFGMRDGSYFIHTETTLENKETGKKYKVLYIEDKDNARHTLYFELT